MTSKIIIDEYYNRLSIGSTAGFTINHLEEFLESNNFKQKLYDDCLIKVQKSKLVILVELDKFNQYIPSQVTTLTFHIGKIEHIQKYNDAGTPKTSLEHRIIKYWMDKTLNYIINVLDKQDCKYDLERHLAINKSGVTADQYINYRLTEYSKYHNIEEIHSYNSNSADSKQIKNHTKIWFKQNNRWMHGICHHTLNSMWLIKYNNFGVTTRDSGRIWVNQPTKLKGRAISEQDSRIALQSEFVKALNSFNFKRAELIYQVLFPNNEECWIIESSKHNRRLWWRPYANGYTSDRIQAGLYRKNELPSPNNDLKFIKVR